MTTKVFFCLFVMEKAIALLGGLGLTVCVYGWRYFMFVMWEDPGVIQGEGVPQEVSHRLREELRNQANSLTIIIIIVQVTCNFP